LIDRLKMVNQRLLRILIIKISIFFKPLEFSSGFFVYKHFQKNQLFLNRIEAFFEWSIPEAIPFVKMKNATFVK